MSFDEEDHPEDEFRREWDKREKKHAAEIRRIVAAHVESTEKQVAIIVDLRDRNETLHRVAFQAQEAAKDLLRQLEAWIAYGESDAHPGHHDLCELNGGGYEPECDCPANMAKPKGPVTRPTVPASPQPLTYGAPPMGLDLSAGSEIRGEVPWGANDSGTTAPTVSGKPDPVIGAGAGEVEQSSSLEDRCEAQLKHGQCAGAKADGNDLCRACLLIQHRRGDHTPGPWPAVPGCPGCPNTGRSRKRP